MTTSRPVGRQLVLLCKCVHYDIISRAAREEVLHLLSQAGAEVQVVDDLCGLAANRDPRLQEWAAMPSLAVVACFPRAVRWLFHAAWAPLPEGRTQFFNMRMQPPEEITRELMKDDGSLMIGEKSMSSVSNHQSSIVNHQSDWVPWFPVIDYDRCVNCKQCFNFCLFGVYGLSAQGQVEVQKPSGCKTNCPACARMCPRQAIIFPKYADPPINGDECPEQTTPREQEQAATDLRKLVAGGVYERIRSRSAGGKRFSTQTQEATGVQRGEPDAQRPFSPGPPLRPAGILPAIRERAALDTKEQGQDALATRGQDARDTAKLPRSCPKLDSLRRELNIPDYVLASLSPTEIRQIIAQSKTGSHSEAEKKGDEPHE